MLKPLSLSVSLAVALGACSLSLAGGHFNKTTYATGQCEPVASAQSVIPSAQSISEGCGSTCGPVAKKSCFSNLFKHKPKTYTYEWVLKKKRCGGLFGHGAGGCDTCGGAATTGCDTCGTTMPSGQYASSQYPTSQALGSTQIPASYSMPQSYGMPQSGGVMPVAPTAVPAAPTTSPTEVPPAPEMPATSTPAPPTASNGGLQLLPAGF